MAVTASLRMTATRAALWGFPLSRSRWYSSLMSGEHLLADSAAMQATSLGLRRPPPMWRPPLMVPLSRAKGATPGRDAACRLPTGPSSAIHAPGAAAVTGPMPGTEARMRWLSANSGDPATVPPLQRRDGGVDVPGDPADLRAGRAGADLRHDGPRPGAMVHESLPQHRHVAEPVDGGGGRGGGPHVRERGPEGRQYPGVHPVGFRKGPGGLREIPRLPRVHDGGGEPPGAQRLQQGPVHAPRRLHDGLHGAALPEEAGDLSEADPVVGGREVPPVDVDVGCTPACAGSGDHCGHALPLLSSR